MFNPKTLKLALHIVTMLTGSLLVGTIVKAEKEAHQRIKTHFTPTDGHEDN